MQHVSEREKIIDEYVLDTAKISVKAGRGGDGWLPSVVKNMCRMAVLEALTAERKWLSHFPGLTKAAYPYGSVAITVSSKAKNGEKG